MDSLMGGKIWQLLLIIFIQFLFSTAQNNDATHMRALKDAWQNTPPSWDDNPDPCNGWVGIRCTISLRVTSITLASIGLAGSLTADIGELSELEILDLSYNKGLNGSLPPAIGNLYKLTNLILVGCGFSGPLPGTLGNLKNLVAMSLNSNGFTGRIPPSIGNIKNLYWLDLADNRLGGSIPVSSGSTPGLDMLINAKHFHFGGNLLTGEIPPRLFNSNMTLIHILFENNQLTGTIPSTLGLVTSLEIVRLDQNFLSGNVPSNINNLTNVYNIHLSNNQLSGPVPNLAGLNFLNYLDLSDNKFDPSDVPSWFRTLQSLTTLKMHNTSLVGQLPATIFSIPQLQNVDLSSNRLNGTLDIGSDYSNQLQQVNLQNNLISDFIQRSAYNINIILVENPICSGMSVTNKLCSLPTNTSTSFSYLTPPNNCVPTLCSSGQVSSPNCRCAFPYSGNLFFRAPSFSNFGNSTYYEALHDSLLSYFRSSQLSVDSVSLRNPTQNMDDYLVINIQIFPFGEDRFDQFGVLGLGFSLSNQTFKAPLYLGTYFFIGEKYDFMLGEGHKSSNKGVIVGSVVGGCVLVALLLFAGMYAFRPKGRVERVTYKSNPFALWDANCGSGATPQLKEAKAFSLEELNKYTNNFSESNNIGTGGYGMVYKGSLPNGQLIAIKRAKQGSTQGGLEFKTEIELLSRVHHKNLVSLVGFCFDQGEQMLVYEYIVNGTLKDNLSGRSDIRLDWITRLRVALGAAKGLQYLHDHADPPIIHRDVKTSNILLDEHLNAKVADFGISKSLGDAYQTHVTTQVNATLIDSRSGISGTRLDWITRMRVALGVPKGLKYLHDHVDPPIIHRDEKTNNILLDKDMNAKLVADFGISKSQGDAYRTHVTTQVKGTLGYMDPEYFSTQQLTEKSDVYSFGVVLLELITARNPIENGKNIVDVVKQCMNKSKEFYDLQEVLDHTIGLTGQLKGLERFVDLALDCVEETRDQRPTMNNVVKEIENIMEHAGLNLNVESTSNLGGYDDSNKGYEHPYTNDFLFDNSGDKFSIN